MPAKPGAPAQGRPLRARDLGWAGPGRVSAAARPTRVVSSRGAGVRPYHPGRLALRIAQLLGLHLSPLGQIVATELLRPGVLVAAAAFLVVWNRLGKEGPGGDDARGWRRLLCVGLVGAPLACAMLALSPANLTPWRARIPVRALRGHGAGGMSRRPREVAAELGPAPGPGRVGRRGGDVARPRHAGRLGRRQLLASTERVSAAARAGRPAPPAGHLPDPPRRAQHLARNLHLPARHRVPLRGRSRPASCGALRPFSIRRASAPPSWVPSPTCPSARPGAPPWLCTGSRISSWPGSIVRGRCESSRTGRRVCPPPNGAVSAGPAHRPWRAAAPGPETAGTRSVMPAASWAGLALVCPACRLGLAIGRCFCHLVQFHILLS